MKVPDLLLETMAKEAFVEWSVRGEPLGDGEPPSRNLAELNWEYAPDGEKERWRAVAAYFLETIRETQRETQWGTGDPRISPENREKENWEKENPVRLNQ